MDRGRGSARVNRRIGTLHAEALEDRRVPTVGFHDLSMLVSRQDGVAVVRLDRNSTTGTEQAVFSTSDGTATAGVDYTATRQLVTFADGEAIKTVSIPLAAGISDGAEKSVLLTLVQGSGSIPPITQTLTIADRADVVSPTALDPKLVTTKGHKITGVVIPFSEAMRPGPAQDLRNYQVIDILKLASAGAPRARPGGVSKPAASPTIALKSAVYDATANSVTLTFAKPLKAKSSFGVASPSNPLPSTAASDPATPPPLTDLAGNPLALPGVPTQWAIGFAFTFYKGVYIKPSSTPPL